MRTKPYIFFWSMMMLSAMLIFQGCMSVTGSQSVIQATNASIFNNKRIAILPAKMQTSLAPDSVMAMRTEVNKRLAPTLRTKVPSAIITDVADVVYQLNQTNSLTNFEQLLSSYEATGVMDKRHVMTLGRILNCDFLLVSRLKSEKLDIGFISKGAGASLDVMLINTGTSEISWAGSGEWKKGGVFGQGGAAFSEFAENIITPAFESLQSSGTASTEIVSPPERDETLDTTPKTKSGKKKGSRKIIAQVQQQLLDLGYEPGPVDGKLGKGTIAAIKKFQKENNLAETGQADTITINTLLQQNKEQSATSGAQSKAATIPPSEVGPSVPPSSNATPEETKQATPSVEKVSPMDL
jgi:hypothetical protein